MTEEIVYTYELLNATTGEVLLANPTEFGGQGEEGYVDFTTADGTVMRFKNSNQEGHIVDVDATDGTYVARIKDTHVEADGEGKVDDIIPEGTKYQIVAKNDPANVQEVLTINTYDTYLEVVTPTIGVRFEKGEDGVPTNDFFELISLKSEEDVA